MTLEDFIVEHWWPLYSPPLNPDWTKTIQTYHLSDMIFQFGSSILTDLTAEHMLQWWGGLQTKHKAKLCNKILITIKKLIKDAHEWGYLESNIAAGLKPVKVPTGESFAKEIDTALFAVLMAHMSPRVKPYVYVARYTGARRASLCSLRWKDVSFTDDTLTFFKTKSGQNLTLPLHPKLRTYLCRLRKHASTNSEFVLPRVQHDSITRAFARAAKKCGIPGTRFHDIRATLATNLIKKGVPLPVVQNVLGHRHIQTTMRYVAVNRKDVQRALRKIQ